MKARKLAAFAALALVMSFSVADARSRGACDGFHRCRCGVTQARHYGFPLVYNGHNLKQAVGWKQAFNQTSAAPGVVLYQHGGGPTGHVSRIVSLQGRCEATVSDDAGTYTRNICSRGAVFLDPNSPRDANGNTRSISVKRKRGHVQMASAPNYPLNSMGSIDPNR